MFVLFTDRQLASPESLSAFNNWINPFSILGHSCVVCVLFWFSAALAPAKQSNHSPSPRARVLHDKRAADVSKTGVFRLPFKTCTKRVFFPIGVDSGIFAFFIRDYRDSDLPQLGRQWSCRFTQSDCFCWSPSCHRSILQRFFQNLIPSAFWYAHLNNTNISQNVTVYRQHLWLRIPSKGNKRIHHRVYAKVICKNDWKFIIIILNIYIWTLSGAACSWNAYIQSRWFWWSRPYDDVVPYLMQKYHEVSPTVIFKLVDASKKTFRSVYDHGKGDFEGLRAALSAIIQPLFGHRSWRYKRRPAKSPKKLPRISPPSVALLTKKQNQIKLSSILIN